MTHNFIDYEEIIQASGHRVTEQRRAILDAVCQGGGHTTLGEIYARARRLDATLDRSTVYRALDLFVALGLVVSADPGTGQTYYEIARPEPHHHLVCESCGRSIELGDETVSTLLKTIQDRYGFEVHSNHLVLVGLCSVCRSKKSDEDKATHH